MTSWGKMRIDCHVGIVLTYCLVFSYSFLDLEIILGFLETSSLADVSKYIDTSRFADTSR